MKTKIRIGITGKRGAIFALLITIAVLLLCGYALFKFITAKTGAADLFASPEKILELNYEESRFEFFAKESAKIAVVQAYPEIAAEGKFTGQECTGDSGYIYFCSLAPDLNEKISLLIEKNINSQIDFYANKEFSKIRYKSSIKENKIKLDAEPLKLTGSSGGTFAYSFVSVFNPSFEISLDGLNLDSFQEIHAKTGDCMPKENPEACMNELSGFETKIKKLENTSYFDLTSKKVYFFQGERRNIRIKFRI